MGQWMYRSTAGWKDLAHAVVNCWVCDLTIAPFLFVDMICKRSINEITNPNPVYNHSITWQYDYNECWVGRYGVDSGRGLFQGSIPAFAWRGWEKQRKTSVTTFRHRSTCLARHFRNSLPFNITLVTIHNLYLHFCLIQRIRVYVTVCLITSVILPHG
jgi:hypothetical protein